MRIIKKSELQNRIKELEDKVKEYDEHNQKLLLFSGHITRLCLENTAAIIKAPDPEHKEIAEFFFKFNVHSFVAYFARAFFYDNKYTPQVREDKEWLIKWNDHVQKILNPLFEIELKKIHEKYHPKIKEPSYIQ